MNLDMTKIQCIFNAIDENIFFKDANGRYILATHVCNMLNSTGDPDFTIYGKTDIEVQPDKEVGRKFYEEDMQIIRTKKSVGYIQEMQFGDQTFYYEIRKNPVIDNDGNVIGIAGIVKDMTDLIKLQDIAVGASYGISMADCEDELNEAIMEADKAMYANKREFKKLRHII